jgi:hypothetical protein
MSNSDSDGVEVISTFTVPVESEAPERDEKKCDLSVSRKRPRKEQGESRHGRVTCTNCHRFKDEDKKKNSDDPDPEFKKGGRAYQAHVCTPQDRCKSYDTCPTKYAKGNIFQDFW